MSDDDRTCTVVGGGSEANQLMHVELLGGEVFITVRKFCCGDTDYDDGWCKHEVISFEPSAIRAVIRELKRVEREADAEYLARMNREDPGEDGVEQ